MKLFSKLLKHQKHSAEDTRPKSCSEDPRVQRHSRQDIIDQAKSNPEDIKFRRFCRQDLFDFSDELDSNDELQ